MCVSNVENLDTDGKIAELNWKRIKRRSLQEPSHQHEQRGQVPPSPEGEVCPGAEAPPREEADHLVRREVIRSETCRRSRHDKARYCEEDQRQAQKFEVLMQVMETVK